MTSPAPPSPDASPPGQDSARDAAVSAVAIWHGLWAGAALVLMLALMTWSELPHAAAFGALAMVMPGLGGLALLWRAGTGERALILVAWTVASLAALMLSGGLAGPLAGYVVMPFAAGIALAGIQGGWRLAQGGAAGTVLAAIGGQVSAWLIGPPAASPVAGALTLAVAMGAAAAVIGQTWGQRDRRAAAAEDARIRVEGLLAAQPSLTLALEPTGRVLAAWGAAPATMDLQALLDHGLVGAVHAPDRSALMAALSRAASGLDAEVRFAPRQALDRRVVLMIGRARLGSRHLIAQAFDATRPFAAEEGLEAARAEAEARDVGKTRFLANMSHELRTPLNAILGFSDIMRQRLFGPLPPKYAEYAGSIHEAGGHLLDLINDVLDVSKIEAERYELSREVFDARDAVSTSVALVRVTAQDKGVGLASLLPDTPMTVDADRRALKQITLNLLSNAIKFTPEGGSVTLTLETIGPYLELVVADTGVGIAARDLQRLGRPFEQAGGADQRAQGTGLGLSLVRALTELHGGRMSLESTLGEGTAVTVRMPVAVAAAAPEGGAEIIPLNAGI